MAHLTGTHTETGAYYHTMLCVAITQPKDRPMKLIWTQDGHRQIFIRQKSVTKTWTASSNSISIVWDLCITELLSRTFAHSTEKNYPAFVIGENWTCLILQERPKLLFQLKVQKQLKTRQFWPLTNCSNNINSKGKLGPQEQKHPEIKSPRTKSTRKEDNWT